MTALFLPAAFVARGEILINEVMSANRSTTCDEDGHYEDWIELKNTGGEPVNLEGYGLTDDPASPFKWTFPNCVIEPGGRLVVWASGKNRLEGAAQPGLLREVYRRTHSGTIEALEANGNYPDFPDSVEILTDRFDAPRHVGDYYGQRISGYLEPPTSGNYEFWIASDNGGRLYLSTDDDPARAEPVAEVPIGLATAEENWSAFSSQRSAIIPLEAGRRYYMFAIMNELTGGDHLSVRWQLDGDPSTAGIIPAGHFIVRPAFLHTNFSLSAAGEPVQLTRPDGVVADLLPAVALPADVSFGRPDADPGTLRYFDLPTRGAPNLDFGYGGIVMGRPSFSEEGGFRDDPFALVLAAAEPGTSIIYTLDGSIPDPEDLGGATYLYAAGYPFGELREGGRETSIYNGPIPITDRSGEANTLSLRTTTFWSSSGYTPIDPVFKGTIVRARLIKPDALPGPVVTHSYFVAPGAASRYQLPVVSISINEDDFFGYADGIYVAGVDYDRWWSAAGRGGDGGTPANYHRRSANAERRAGFELFLPEEGRVYGQQLGVRVHGGWSRASPQKSLRFYADTDYDSSDWLEYPLIPGLTGRRTGLPVTSFRRFLLRNAGNDQEGPRIRDAFMQTLAEPLGLDQQGFQPALHFINGEYWGHVNIRERVDRYFIAAHHGVDPDGVAILSNNAEISEGGKADRDDFLALREYILTHDMSDPAHYAHVAERMDLENFIRYNVVEIYVNNRDWPHNNVDFWRVSPDFVVPGTSGTTDGRWRWILFDLDFGFGLSGGADVDTLSHALRHAESQDWSTAPLRALLENADFRNTFINTFADHMATSFQPSRVNQLADAMHAQVAPSLVEHAQRWRHSTSSSVASIKNFGALRPGHMRQHLMTRFGLSGTAALTLDTPDPSRGSVGINSIAIDASTPGLVNPAQPYPWTGTYFLGVPVTVTAQPADGYRFEGWLERPEETSASLVVMPGEEAKLTALFAPRPVTQLIHYWNFNEGGALFVPNVSLVGGASLGVSAAPASEITSDTGQDFVGANARLGDAAGTHLRLNNPIGSTIEIALPTTGFEDIRMRYEVRRSGQGAGVQSFAYSTDGDTFLPFEDVAVTESPAVRTLDFSAVPGVAQNPDFTVRITFAEGAGGTEGNNRFDNITLEGRAMDGADQPPQIKEIPGLQPLIEGAAPAVTALSDWFEDPDGDPLEFFVENSHDDVLEVEVDGANLSLRGLRRGDATMTIRASDGVLESIPLEIPVLVHPAPHPLAVGPFDFREWSSGEPEGSYPPHMLFVQSDVSDPGVGAALDRAYRVGDDHHPDDSEGFPYNNTSRTRINGLGGAGISFINTGRDRDVGGAIVALDTRGVAEARVAFTASTMVVNQRSYALRLQYRVGTSGPFLPVSHGGAPVLYPSATLAGDTRDYENIALPPAALNRSYVQLLWRYHHASGSSGARAQIRLDDIEISGGLATGFEYWKYLEFPDAGDFDNPAISGPDADPFGLGVSNLMRYALDIDADSDVALRVPRLTADEETGALEFRFPFDSGKSDVRFLVEASPDLRDWDEVLFDSLAAGGVAPEAGWIGVEIPSEWIEAEPEGFFRLRLELDASGESAGAP